MNMDQRTEICAAENFLFNVPEIHSTCQFVDDVKTKSCPHGLVVHFLFHGERFGLKYDKRSTISSNVFMLIP